MLWVKLTAGTTSFWLEIPTDTQSAMEQIKGIELGVKMFAQIPVAVIDTRYSKQPMAKFNEDVMYEATDEELTAAFLSVAKEMGRRGRKVWEEFFEALAADTSADADEVRGWLDEYRTEE